MFRSLIFVVLLGVSGFFAWKQFFKPEALTPQQEVERFAAKGSVSAVELADIADRHPELLRKALRDRRITVSGVLQKALVKGVGSHDLILDLEGTRKRKITFTSDVNSYARANSQIGISKRKFQKIGRDIVVYESAPKAAKSSPGGGVIQKMLGAIVPSNSPPESEQEAPHPESKQEPNQKSAPVERVIFRELDTVTLEGIFQHITNAAVFIEWRPAQSL
ncbi:MAG: hypothetical protein ACKOHM_08205 [Spartobacteria bacterium]